MVMMSNVRNCAFCGELAEGNFAIHRDGFGVGPEVDLCNDCGGSDSPSLTEIWNAIAIPLTEDEEIIQDIIE